MGMTEVSNEITEKDSGCRRAAEHGVNEVGR